MGLRLKFNLVLLGVFAIGLAVSGDISYELLRRNAQDEVVRSAGLMMETALATLTPATLAQAARRLAEHIGPVARVLVDQESRAAASPAELYARLARHIRDPTARQAFVTGAPG
jgi:hypothetical protein